MTENYQETKEAASASGPEFAQGNGQRSWHDLVLWVGALPLFTGFLYYVGRRYTEAQYQAIGIPPDALTFSSADYVFQGFKSWMFLIGVLVTALVVQLWTTHQTKSIRDDSAESLWTKVREIVGLTFHVQKGQPQLMLVWILFYCAILGSAGYGFASLLLAPNVPVGMMLGFVSGILPICMAVNIIADHPTIAFIRTRQTLYPFFVAVVILSAALTVQFLPSSLGTFVGIRRAYNPSLAFPTARVIVIQPQGPGDLQWNVQNNGQYVNSDTLVMLLDTGNQVYLRRLQNNSSAFAIRSSGIVAIEFQSPNLLPKSSAGVSK